MNSRAYVLLAPALAALACGKVNLASLEPGPLCAEPDPQPDCKYQNTCAAINAFGRLSADLAAINELIAPIQWNNQAPSDADTTAGRVNNRDAFIEEFRIHYTGLANLPDGSVTQTFVVPAASSQTALVELIPPAMVTIIGTAIAAKPGFTEVVAEVKARGRYADGTTFETGGMKIPVDVCLGCFGAAPACPTAGQFLYCCPQYGQTANCKCQ